MPKFVKDYGLSILLWTQFLVSLALYMEAAYVHWAETGREGTLGWIWLQEIMENWQSEALQVAVLVWATKHLLHRDSPQSRDGDDEMKADIKEIKAALKGGDHVT